MSAAQIIEEIRALPPEEQQAVFQFVERMRDGNASSGGVDQRFKDIADEMFTKNSELFRKLAQ